MRSCLRDAKRSAFSDFRKFANTRETPKVLDVYGYSLEGNRTIVYYPDSSLQTLSRAMNILSNLYLSLLIPYASGHGISVSHVPLQEIFKNRSGYWEPKQIFLCTAWATWVSFCQYFMLLRLLDQLLLNLEFVAQFIIATQFQKTFLTYSGATNVLAQSNEGVAGVARREPSAKC